MAHRIECTTPADPSKSSGLFVVPSNVFVSFVCFVVKCFSWNHGVSLSRQLKPADSNLSWFRAMASYKRRASCFFWLVLAML